MTSLIRKAGKLDRDNAVAKAFELITSDKHPFDFNCDLDKIGKVIDARAARSNELFANLRDAGLGERTSPLRHKSNC